MISTHCIRVQGRELQVRSTSGPEHVTQVEAFVNQKLSEAAGAASGVDSQVVAILALMNIAEAYLALQAEHAQVQSVTQQRLSGLLDQLNLLES